MIKKHLLYQAMIIHFIQIKKALCKKKNIMKIFQVMQIIHRNHESLCRIPIEQYVCFIPVDIFDTALAQ